MKINNNEESIKYAHTSPDAEFGYLILPRNAFYQNHTILTRLEQLMIGLGCIGYTYKSIAEQASLSVPEELAENLVSPGNNLATG